jgi:non-ribosomal peptide synthase protein (TIGR01720 family)
LEAVGYGALRYLGDEEAMAALDEPAADISFDYLGGTGVLYPGGLLTQEIAADLGPVVHPTWRRPHIIEIQACLSGRRLAIEWTYSRALHRESTVRSWAYMHLRQLIQLIDDE